MTEKQHEHIDPNPARPSQAEGEAQDEEKPSTGAAEEAGAAQEGTEPDDPSARRPSQAEGEPNR